ncbi:hypothetical protein COO60DRAFT_1505533 [Scenedesmus sp. NREL 46B-D3]|nr:hypothetical protein COO60DRAFT_1505533 [Scenedesmus sp. NREL 46B-D3]
MAHDAAACLLLHCNTLTTPSPAPSGKVQSACADRPAAMPPASRRCCQLTTSHVMARHAHKMHIYPNATAQGTTAAATTNEACGQCCPAGITHAGAATTSVVSPSGVWRPCHCRRPTAAARCSACYQLITLDCPLMHPKTCLSTTPCWVPQNRS